VHFRRLVPRLVAVDAPLVWLSGWPGSGRRLLLQACQRELDEAVGALPPNLAHDHRALRAELARFRAAGVRRFVGNDWPAAGIGEALGWLQPHETLLASSGSHLDELDADARARSTTIGPVELLLRPEEVRETLARHRADPAGAETWRRFSDGWLVPLQLALSAVENGAAPAPEDDGAAARLLEHEALRRFLRERVLVGLGTSGLQALRRLARALEEAPAESLEALRRRAGLGTAWHDLLERRQLVGRFEEGLRLPRPLALSLRERSPRRAAADTRAQPPGKVVLRLLGPPRVELIDAEGSAEEVSWPFRRVLQLLALLALAPEGCTQERVLETLWPDAELPPARANLHPTVSHLRRLLAPAGGPGSAVLLHAGVYRLNPAWRFSIDARSFEELAGAAPEGAPEERLARLEEAWRLYRGPLLEGMSEPWTLEPRRRLEQRHRVLLWELAEHYARLDRFEESEDCLRTLLVADPLREDVHLRLMLLHARRGRTDLVRRQYEKLCRLLAHELGAQPLDETVRAVERLLG
jgi:DNA-binding SARP family transcriptional activator